MSVHDNKTRIAHIKEAAQKIIVYTQGKTQKDFEQDEILQLATIRLIEIIGEAAARLTTEFREHHPDMPWQAIIGMRNRLVHAYFAIDYDIVWVTVTKAIPELLKQVNTIQFEDDKDRDS